MIELVNIKPGDVIKTQIAYIFGKCFDKSDNIRVVNASTREALEWQVKNCFFKVFNLFNYKINKFFKLHEIYL